MEEVAAARDDDDKSDEAGDEVGNVDCANVDEPTVATANLTVDDDVEVDDKAEDEIAAAVANAKAKAGGNDDGIEDDEVEVELNEFEKLLLLAAVTIDELGWAVDNDEDEDEDEDDDDDVVFSDAADEDDDDVDGIRVADVAASTPTAAFDEMYFNNRTIAECSSLS